MNSFPLLVCLCFSSLSTVLINSIHLDGERKPAPNKEYTGGPKPRTAGSQEKSTESGSQPVATSRPAKPNKAPADESNAPQDNRRQTTQIPLTTQPLAQPTTQPSTKKPDTTQKTKETKKAPGAPLPPSSLWGAARDWSNHFAPPTPPQLSAFPSISGQKEEQKPPAHESVNAHHTEVSAPAAPVVASEPTPKREIKVVEPVGPKPVVPAAPLMASGTQSYAAALAASKKTASQQKTEAAPAPVQAEQTQEAESSAPAPAAEESTATSSSAPEQTPEPAVVAATEESSKPVKEKKSKKKGAKATSSSTTDAPTQEADAPALASQSTVDAPEVPTAQANEEATLTVTSEPAESQSAPTTVDIPSSTVQETQAPVSEPAPSQPSVTESPAPQTLSSDTSNSEATPAVNTKRNAPTRVEKSTKAPSKATKPVKPTPKASAVISFGSFVPQKPPMFQFGSFGLPEDATPEDVTESQQVESQNDDTAVVPQKEEFSEAAVDVANTAESPVPAESSPVASTSAPIAQEVAPIPASVESLETVAVQQQTLVAESLSQPALSPAPVQQQSIQPNPQSNGILPLNPGAPAPRTSAQYQQQSQPQQGPGAAGQRPGPMGSHQAQKSGAYYHNSPGSMGYGGQAAFSQDFSDMQNTGFTGSNFNTPAAPLGNYGAHFYEDPSRGQFAESTYMGNHFDGNSNGGPGNRRGPRNPGNNVRGGYDRNGGVHQNAPSNPNVGVNMTNPSVGGNGQQPQQPNPAVNSSAGSSPANPPMGMNTNAPGMMDPNVVHGMQRGGFGHMFPPQMFYPFMGHPFYGFGSPFPMASGSNHYVPPMMPGFPMSSEDESHTHPAHSHPAPHGHNMPYPPNGPHMMPHMYNQQMGMPHSHPHAVGHETPYSPYPHQAAGMPGAQNPPHSKVHPNHAGNTHPAHNHGEHSYRPKGPMGGDGYGVSGGPVSSNFYQGGQGNPGNMPPHNRQQNTTPKWT
eukprot:TRINITY_DN1980_c0_g1_i1.p1 TRINITY_DN1980_c0_g1~~TRINITY_DN1980_c0_g1_i1.p1  ORF type:complete len:971 (-),score=195.59 TRINITY_DN1980_c0_g1_i1:360-3272(-)